VRGFLAEEYGVDLGSKLNQIAGEDKSTLRAQAQPDTLAKPRMDFTVIGFPTSRPAPRPQPGPSQQQKHDSSFAERIQQ
jgi:hypothetical protein